ncbi:ABC transporter permease [uncultured Kocuria sp.]|uniref:ABC transporter permease n=1 Tax=uncultured Kocuria sp. TaxID=259305 RepID=UPI002593E50C|nr:ABC transporter permease [uncultured Kocuria sp.]MCT1367238.1 ABC transporter permease [Rothia sp. p3-SID1597]
MNFALYTAIDLRRILADRSGLFFSIVLPVLFYLLFGAMQNYSDMPLNDGNVGAYVMIGMATYGGVIAACATVGNVVVEQTTGWGRQIALTPLSTGSMLMSKAIIILVRAAMPVAAVNIAGIFTVADMPLGEWISAALISIVVSLPFGFYGMIFGLLFRSDSAVSISSTGLVILAFLGNAFSPLPEFLLGFARFTPMYGPSTLARYPLSEGIQSISDGSGMVTDPLWYSIANVLAWTLIFAGLCALLGQRQKGRP